ncbi:MAG: hypothetical protein WAV51_03185 [Microgenomates group bacterium]
MPFLGKFILTFLTSAVVVSGASLAWPKLTSQPMPEMLKKVREFVIQTDAGKQTAETLGVTDMEGVEPINISSVAASAVSTVVTTASEKVQETATKEIIIQVVKKIETLDPESQTVIKEVICK